MNRRCDAAAERRSAAPRRRQEARAVLARAKSHFYIRSSEWRRSEIRFFGGDRQNFGIVISGLPVQFFRQGPTISNDSISDKDSVTA